MDKLLSADSAAELLGVSRWLVYSYARKGYFKAIRINSGHYKFSSKEIQSFIEQLKRNTPAPEKKKEKEEDEFDKAIEKIQLLANESKREQL